MMYYPLAAVLLLLLLPLPQVAIAAEGGRSPVWRRPRPKLAQRDNAVFAPKVFVINMYEGEGTTWLTRAPFNTSSINITVPGLSPRFPNARCLTSGEACEMVTDEGEINAAASVLALAFSPQFDLAKTYFLISGIAGVNPACGTAGGVALARFAVQATLQYEVDAREIPSNFTTGYFPLGTMGPGMYPQFIYGTEVFELNCNLRDRALLAASRAKLNDTTTSKKYRARYLPGTPASKPPKVFAGDMVTADNFFSGKLLGDAFSNYTALVSNGTARYCMSQQEDNATLEALLRAAPAARADFARAIILRSASHSDRPPPGETVVQNLQFIDLGLALDNQYRAGFEVLQDILKNWSSVYAKGIKPQNYIGDILDTLHGPVRPDFGLPSAWI